MDEYPPGFEEDERRRSNFIRQLTLRQLGREQESSSRPERRDPTACVPRTLVRFWHEHDNVPLDVRRCLDSWEALRDEGISFRMFGDASAAAYIARRYGQRELAALVRVFDGDEEPMDAQQLNETLRTFDALVDAPLLPDALDAAVADQRSVFVREAKAQMPASLETNRLLPSRSAVVAADGDRRGSWDALCAVLGVPKPVYAFPAGAHRTSRVFRDERATAQPGARELKRGGSSSMDESPWVLPPSSRWRPSRKAARPVGASGSLAAQVAMTQASKSFPGLDETFPGNLASFARENLRYSDDGAQLVIDAVEGGLRPYRSGAFASEASFTYGRFEAEVRQPRDPGLSQGSFSIAPHPGRRSTSSLRVPIPGECWSTCISMPATTGRPWPTATAARPGQSI
jgi:hypothetical protein